MKNWKKILVLENTPIIEVMKIIDKETSQFAIVIKPDHTLVGTITDGDIRRAILKGINLTEPCQLAMNANPICISLTTTEDQINKYFNLHNIHRIPILNSEKQVVGVKSRNEKSFEIDNPVVIMAGGLGSRLGELTTNTPKPLLKIGDKPILEIIIENFKAQGFYNFYISVNYKSEMIEAYFKNGENHNVKITYIKENIKLGTAGALSLIEESISKPIIIMNGDLLTNVDFQKLINYHESSESLATMCVRQYEFQVPFGVVNLDHDKILKINEKPIQQFFVNAGIYVLDPSLLKKIPKNEFYDMPSLFNQLLNENKKTTAFPIHEYWLDIGQKDDLQKAQEEVSLINKKK